jgi:hypothetical protein
MTLPRGNPFLLMWSLPENVTSQFSSSVFVFGKAILILLVGLILANIAREIVKKGLRKTELDNQFAAWITGRSDGKSLPVEQWVGDLAYWLIFLFALVAFFNALQLEAVYEPLNSLLKEITSFSPKILGATILFALAWAIATLSKVIINRTLEKSQLSQRLGLTPEREVEGEETEKKDSLAETIGNALYWFIYLLFLPSILSTLDLQGTLAPVQGLLDSILSILPNILGSILIGAVGWVVAQIVSRVVTNLAATTGVNKIGEKFGLRAGDGRKSLSQILGVIVYVLILIPVAITALDALKIQAISQPATEMLNQVLTLIPKLFAASVILVLAYVAGQYIAELVSSLLVSLGFNNLYDWLGFSLNNAPAQTSTEDEEASNSGVGVATKTPSELVGIMTLVGVMLVASLTAVDILKINALTRVVGVILQISAQVLVGLVIFTFGLYLANLAFKLISSSGNRQARLLGHTARIAILVLVSAMALQQMGIAPNIVNLAFGLLVGGIAVAIALAFGLGGRDVASEQLRQWLNAFRDES